jgi:predicted component of type VI protein secretion system
MQQQFLYRQHINLCKGQNSNPPHCPALPLSTCSTASSTMTSSQPGSQASSSILSTASTSTCARDRSAKHPRCPACVCRMALSSALHCTSRCVNDSQPARHAVAASLPPAHRTVQGTEQQPSTLPCRCL